MCATRHTCTAVAVTVAPHRLESQDLCYARASAAIESPGYRRASVPAVQRVTRANRLLAGLPGKDRQRMLASCEPVDLVFGDILARVGERIEQVYFPTEGCI